MKGKNKSLIWMLPVLFVLASNMQVFAQDDLYYDPSTDSKPVPTYEQTYEEPNNANRSSDSDDQYYEEDDYAYEYSSRIRRFHQPAPPMDYYDPMFVDLYHYDPYYSPGASIYTYGYNDYWSYRRWQAWNAYNPWNPWNPYAGYGYGYGPGWSVSIGFGACNPWYNPFVWNNYYYDPYWTWNGYNPYYNSCGVNHGYYYYNNPPYYNNGGGGNNGYNPQTYVGPRRGGTSVGGNNGNYARLTNGTGSDGRLAVADTKAPVIEMKTRPTSTRTVVDKQKAMAGQQVDRVVPSESRKPATTIAKDPNAAGGRTGEKSEKIRPATEPRPSRGEALPGDNVPSNRTPATETRPSRQPSQQTNPARSQETRPSRPSGGNEEARPSRPSSQDRPSRSSGGSTETRPSRSSSDGGGSRTISPSSSGRSSSGDSGSSGRSSSGGSSSGGSSKSSGGGGKSGRN